MSELKVDKAKVQEAAKQCPDAARVLKTLFPEAFAGEEKLVPFLNSNALNGHARLFLPEHPMYNHICIRGAGKYKENGLFLSNYFQYRLETDEHGIQVLVVERKKTP